VVINQKFYPSIHLDQVLTACFHFPFPFPPFPIARLKAIQVAKRFPNSIVPFHPLKCMGSPGEKMYLFSVFHCACQSSYF